MSADGGFLVEDFLDAVSAQLDRTQDALAAKAKVRPMTFALRTFAIDLQVFVGMDPNGNVRLRSAAPGEEGASTLKLDFTTITRPMIEENTVSLEATQSPSLEEVGLKPDEQRQLERIGVRTVAQLQTLGSSGAGVDGIARLTDGSVPADRLREAMRLGRPQVFHVASVPPPSAAPHAADATAADPLQPPPLTVAPGTKRLQFVGRNLLAGGRTPAVRLDGRPLAVTAARDDRLEVELPAGGIAGALEVDLGDEEPMRCELRAAPLQTDDQPRWSAEDDAWSSGPPNLPVGTAP